jgi:hypothetical protein
MSLGAVASIAVVMWEVSGELVAVSAGGGGHTLHQRGWQLVVHGSGRGIDCCKISSELDIPFHGYTLHFQPVDPMCMRTSFVITNPVCERGMSAEL